MMSFCLALLYILLLKFPIYIYIHIIEIEPIDHGYHQCPMSPLQK